jgi:hypothetical protein
VTDQAISAEPVGSGLRASCPVCAAPTGDPFVRIPGQPVHCNVLWTTRVAAVEAPRGDLDLVFCSSCGHVFNAAFDDSLTTYGATYENSLHHSAVFQGYADELVTTLVERHGLRDRDVVEIGSGGHGDFLDALCTRGGNRGVGFDPSYVGPAQVSEHVRVVADFYGEQFADQPADFIVCRHVLEHIGAAGDFVGMVRRVIGDRDVTAFFEVPDARWTLLHGGIWDLIYEHCGYFTPTSLRAAFELNGFTVDHVGTVFGDQFLTIEATPAPRAGDVSAASSQEVAELADAAHRFADLHTETIGRWRRELRSRTDDGQRGVIWGAGSKGVTFLNVVEGAQVCDRAVDINPRKHGMYVSGAGQAVVGPDTLPDDPPDFVLVMNPNYRDEIGVQLHELGIDADVLVV